MAWLGRRLSSAWTERLLPLLLGEALPGPIWDSFSSLTGGGAKNRLESLEMVVLGIDENPWSSVLLCLRLQGELNHLGKGANSTLLSV